jgi:hypothetical protein
VFSSSEQLATSAWSSATPRRSSATSRRSSATSRRSSAFPGGPLPRPGGPLPFHEALCLYQLIRNTRPLLQPHRNTCHLCQLNYNNFKTTTGTARHLSLIPWDGEPFNISLLHLWMGKFVELAQVTPLGWGIPSVSLLYLWM